MIYLFKNLNKKTICVFVCHTLGGLYKDINIPCKLVYNFYTIKELKKVGKIFSYPWLCPKNGWKIIHVKYYRQYAQGDELFSKESSYSGYISEFKPRKNEKEVIKLLYSSFSAPEFEQELEKHPGSSIFIIGYNTPLCVLSTIIEGYHRDYEMTLLKDASSAKSDGITPEKERHEILTSVLSSFGKIQTVDEVIAESAKYGS